MRRALLATDASEASLRAAKFLSEMARVDPDLHVTVLHVTPLPDVLTATAAVGTPVHLPDHLDEYVAADDKEVLNRTCQALGLPEERVTLVHEVGLVGDTILSYVNQNTFDFVVMGRRGLSSLREILLGSVSQAVLHRCHVPVIVVP